MKFKSHRLSFGKSSQVNWKSAFVRALSKEDAIRRVRSRGSEVRNARNRGNVSRIFTSKDRIRVRAISRARRLFWERRLPTSAGNDDAALRRTWVRTGGLGPTIDLDRHVHLHVPPSTATRPSFYPIRLTRLTFLCAFFSLNPTTLSPLVARRSR